MDSQELKTYIEFCESVKYGKYSHIIAIDIGDLNTRIGINLISTAFERGMKFNFINYRTGILVKRIKNKNEFKPIGFGKEFYNLYCGMSIKKRMKYELFTRLHSSISKGRKSIRAESGFTFSISIVIEWVYKCIKDKLNQLKELSDIDLNRILWSISLPARATWAQEIISNSINSKEIIFISPSSSAVIDNLFSQRPTTQGPFITIDLGHYETRISGVMVDSGFLCVTSQRTAPGGESIKEEFIKFLSELLHPKEVQTRQLIKVIKEFEKLRNEMNSDKRPSSKLIDINPLILDSEDINELVNNYNLTSRYRIALVGEFLSISNSHLHSFLSPTINEILNSLSEVVGALSEELGSIGTIIIVGGMAKNSAICSYLTEHIGNVEIPKEPDFSILRGLIKYAALTQFSKLNRWQHSYALQDNSQIKVFINKFDPIDYDQVYELPISSQYLVIVRINPDNPGDPENVARTDLDSPGTVRIQLGEQRIRITSNGTDTIITPDISLEVHIENPTTDLLRYKALFSKEDEIK